MSFAYIQSMKNTVYKIIAGATALTMLTGTAYANGDCEPTYGGGQTCVYNKNFEIKKEVRKEGDDNWHDKITGVKKGQIIEFRIRVKNSGEVETDDMRMKDILPDELSRVSGDLTEEWDNFEIGEKKEFIIKAKVDKDEYDNKNFKNCIVNEAHIYFGDKHEGSDTATVCYESKEVKELPDTGASTGLLGLGLLTSGIVLKRNRKLAC